MPSPKSRIAAWTYWLAAFSLLASAQGSTAQPARICLRDSAADTIDAPRTCQPDPANYATDDRLRTVVRKLHLENVSIEILACSGKGFDTFAEEVDGGYRATIRYPSAGKGRQARYIAPFAHELGHVLQVRQAGDLATLTKLKSRQIELGADFLAGFALREVQARSIDVVEYTSNLNLVGQFKVTADDHGQPVHRANAFRYGYEYAAREKMKTPEEAHLFFLGNLLPEMEQSTEGSR